MAELTVNWEQVGKARQAAEKIAAGVEREINKNTTVAVERAVLRVLGVEGSDGENVPLVNRVVDQLLTKGVLGRGAAIYLVNGALSRGEQPVETAAAVAGGLDLTTIPALPVRRLEQAVVKFAREGLEKIDRSARHREELQQKLGMGAEPLKYLIVATGNIYDDVKQARAAVRQGADIIAVIRHTAQSLLDYVPPGINTEGVGGTMATRENFRIMRRGLDQAGEEAGRYILLTNYCSGLCMPEMAVLGAEERLDVMLNDSMYGVIFRDINAVRTFIDQHFSRMLLARAGIIINTGEDNYLTTADAFEKAHTVLASQFINEQFAILSGLPARLIGLGHAFEISPDIEDSFLFELAQAQLVRQIFPDYPLKYMPPTKYMTGNIFQGMVQNALFNAVSILTKQSIHLLGMPTEALHTPHIHDRYLSLANVDYVFTAMKHLGEEITFKPHGLLQERADQILGQAVAMLEEVAEIGMLQAIARGMFADIPRSPEGGKGFQGVVPKDPDYWNPVMQLLGEEG